MLIEREVGLGQMFPQRLTRVLPHQAMTCGTHFSCGIPVERCGEESAVGVSDKGHEVLGRISGFWLSLLLGKSL